MLEPATTLTAYGYHRLGLGDLNRQAAPCTSWRSRVHYPVELACRSRNIGTILNTGELVKMILLPSTKAPEQDEIGNLALSVLHHQSGLVMASTENAMAGDQRIYAVTERHFEVLQLSSGRATEMS